MCRFIFLSIVVILLSSCASQENNTDCRYTLNNLYAELDSIQVETKNYQNENLIEVLDKQNLLGQRGLYKFDDNKILRFYAFLYDKQNNFVYGIEYDSLGKEIKKTGGEVVQWYFKKSGTDSLEITFLLFSLNNIYKNISVEINNRSFQINELYKSSKFSNLQFNIIDLDLNSITKFTTLYIKGTKINKCNNKEKVFKDSVQIPVNI